MRQFTINRLFELLDDPVKPCVSLYQPTHRHHPDNQQDPIRYRNLLRQIETSLEQNRSAQEVGPILEKFQALVHDDQFWNHRTDGLAVLCAPNTFQIVELQRPVPELVVVADSFHLKPLYRIVQSADRYHILCLSRSEARLFEANRDAIDAVELTEVPSTITDALGEKVTEPHQTVASYGSGAGAGAGAAMRHGHGSKPDEVAIDRDRFFRVVDRGVLEHHSRPSGLPLMLAALPEHHAPFHAISHNPYLVPDGITINPDTLELDQLRVEAWKKMEPHYRERLAVLVSDYELAKSRQQGSDDLSQIAQAVSAGKVAVLLVEADRQVPGRVQPDSGTIQFGDLAEPEIDDVLDDLAELTLRMSGEVVVVPAERMPSTTGLAATYRY